MNPLELSLSVDESGLKGGKVLIKATLKNVSEQAHTFLPWNTPVDKSVTARFYELEMVHDSVAVRVPYQGVMVKRLAPTPDDYVTIVANGIIQNVQDITKSYKFCAQQTYIISFSNNFFTPNYNNIATNSVQFEFMTGTNFPACDQANN